jgi:hypothetical protein
METLSEEREFEEVLKAVIASVDRELERGALYQAS